MESRIEELEAKICLAEDLLDALNRTVYRQQQALEALQAEVRALRLQLRDAVPDEAAASTQEVPPHY